MIVKVFKWKVFTDFHANIARNDEQQHMCGQKYGMFDAQSSQCLPFSILFFNKWWQWFLFVLRCITWFTTQNKFVENYSIWRKWKKNGDWKRERARWCLLGNKGFLTIFLLLYFQKIYEIRCDMRWCFKKKAKWNFRFWHIRTTWNEFQHVHKGLLTFLYTHTHTLTYSQAQQINSAVPLCVSACVIGSVFFFSVVIFQK